MKQKSSYFRTEFAESIFKAKYAHEGAETWDRLSFTLIDDVAGDILDKHERAYLTKLHTEMKFIAGGRYLYYAGREWKFFNNCGNASTLLLTDKGFEPMGSYTNGETVRVYSPITRDFEEATMHTHGEQQMYNITLAELGSNGRYTTSLRFTAKHKWPTQNRGVVQDLRVGDIISPADVVLPEDELGFIHGLVYADGNVHPGRKKGDFGHQLRLCGKKAEYAHLFDMEGYSVTYPEFAKGDPLVYFRSSYNFKELPVGMPLSYIASFLRGWAAFDGHFAAAGSHSICSINREAIEFFIEHAPLAGYTITTSVKTITRATNYGERKNALYQVGFKESSRVKGFKVISMEEDGTELAYCPFEPKHNRIVVDHGIDTFNCFLLKALEDTRQDWASLSERAISCLMTGGGIGVDYSVYRAKGTPLGKTGGVASGPVSKMKMTNEEGREVMQGGGRRSAIYGSLNWQHGDARELLSAKDWRAMPVAGAYDKEGRQLTVADLKEADFNYPAPLDMTNISLNYDNDFLEQVYQMPIGEIRDRYRAGLELEIKCVPAIFVENVRMALRNGEPGLSFNFFEKVNETLRNACCEVVSEDDSDVCNLASVNMANIATIEEFERVCYHASRFLVCGTLKADLPYEKVYETRQKNRRLGLGLMGVHEWLLKRGYRYEVTPELHQWLKVYQQYSEVGANELCDQLSINRPVAYRAIAPTGSIGILACTSTGIEPLFAVAYKRRFIKGVEKSWHYQYVVDGTAKVLIDQYGVDPDTIETALDLAADPERRIKFQADVQDYVDMAISSTINISAFGSDLNPDSEEHVAGFAMTLLKYAHRLRGFTVYPDGSRGGQPLTAVPYLEAKSMEGQEFEEVYMDICDISGGGTCGS